MCRQLKRKPKFSALTPKDYESLKKANVVDFEGVIQIDDEKIRKYSETPAESFFEQLDVCLDVCLIQVHT